MSIRLCVLRVNNFFEGSAPGGTRTRDLGFAKHLLYPSELRAHPMNLAHISVSCQGPTGSRDLFRLLSSIRIFHRTPFFMNHYILEFTSKRYDLKDL